jgi:hypothetical protein
MGDRPRSWSEWRQARNRGKGVGWGGSRFIAWPAYADGARLDRPSAPGPARAIAFPSLLSVDLPQHHLRVEGGGCRARAWEFSGSGIQGLRVWCLGLEGLGSQPPPPQQVLRARGEGHADAERALRARLEASEAEVRVLRDRAAGAAAAGAAAAAEAERASSASGSLAATAAALQQRLEAEAERARRAEEEWRGRCAAVQAAAEGEAEALRARLMQAEARLMLFRADGDARERAAAPGGGGAEEELPGRLREAEGELDRLRRLLGSIEQENATLADELDNVLLENASLRQRVDSGGGDEDDSGAGGAAERGGGRRGGAGLLDGEAAASNASLYGTRGGGAGVWPGTGGRRRGGRRGPTTCGLHTPRLSRAAFEGWRWAVVEVRMWGKNPAFTCLEPFLSPDGAPADWLPAGRVRRGDFEVRSGERVGSGTFAEVLRGELRIPCAVKRIKGPVQHKELLEFVREGEMMRALVHPCVVRLIGVQAEPGQYHLLQVRLCFGTEPLQCA